MIVYQPQEITVKWPEPLETTWQYLGGGKGVEIAPRLPHLDLTEILFMSTVMSIPRAERPWGVVTWMAEVFEVSRPGLYALTKRVKERLLPPAEPEALPASQSGGSRVTVTQNRLARTVLMTSLPGKTAIRPLQQILGEAFDQTRSIGWISELLSTAGQKSGQILSEIDTSPLGTVIVARDETFFQGQPLLLIIEPVSSTIVFAQVTPDRQAETWATALLLAQDQGLTIGGLVEDMASMYAKSQVEAELEVAVQKDIWHIQRDGAGVLRALERSAFRATRQVLDLEKKLLKKWDDPLFTEKYIPAVDKEALRYDQHDAFAQWLVHLIDALEMVDWRSGEIRERDINAWLLDETLAAMSLIDHPAVLKWVKTLRRHQAQLLTALDWLETSLVPFRQHLAAHLAPDHHRPFMRIVARHWRLNQALINGHASFSQLAQQAHEALRFLIADDLKLHQLAQALLALFDAAARTSSMIENVNGLLKQFLYTHQAFRNPDTLQLYLNLFVLWHNTRVFERGKRQGRSPYQIAGIDPGSDDWLDLLGFPAC